MDVPVARISVATLTELLVGVRRAPDGPLRVLQATLQRARAFIAMPYDEAVAERLADLLTAARDQRRRAGRWTPSSPPPRSRTT